jgi:hypothetical protein
LTLRSVQSGCSLHIAIGAEPGLEEVSVAAVKAAPLSKSRAQLEGFDPGSVAT